MLSVRLAIITLNVIPSGWAQQVTTIPPDAAGIELIGSQAPDFRASVEAVVGPQALPQLGPYLPFTVVLKNNSSQVLVGYYVQWTINGSGGGSGIGTLATKGPDQYLKPGAAVVLIPGFELTKTPSAEMQASMLRKTSALSVFQSARTIAISLDSAIFSSGEFVGPDTRKNFAQDAAYFSAWRAVDSDVQSKLATGESFDFIAVGLSQIANQTIEGSRASRDWNAEVQATEARQLLKLHEKSGIQAVRDRLQQQLQQPTVLVHR